MSSKIFDRTILISLLVPFPPEDRFAQVVCNGLDKGLGFAKMRSAKRDGAIFALRSA